MPLSTPPLPAAPAAVPAAPPAAPAAVPAAPPAAPATEGSAPPVAGEITAWRPPGQLALLAAGLAGPALNSYPSMEVIRAPPYEGSDLEVECREYTLSTLSAAERAAVLREPPLTLKQIESLIRVSSTDRLSDEGAFVLDGELLREVDLRTRAAVYVVNGTGIFDEEQLLKTYPFREMGVEPREVFAQQELAIFGGAHGGTEYMTRDLGTVGQFMTVEDQVMLHLRGQAPRPRRLERAVKTKVYIARGGWEDFLGLQRQVRAFSRFGQAAVARAAADGRPNLLALMMGGLAGQAALESSSAAAERAAGREAELTRREAAAARLEAELDQRTEDLLGMLAGMRADLAPGAPAP